MSQKSNCEIVKDLLPNYIEKLTSIETNGSIEEHLETCEDCRGYYKEMKEDIPAESIPEAVPFKNYLSKVKTTYVMSGLLFVGILSILICFLVNYILERQFSWSLIVFGGVAFGYAVIYTFFKSKKDKIVKTMACITVLIIPLLALIQMSIYYFIDNRQPIWFWNIGLPITIMWLVIIWLTIIISNRNKLNFFYVISLLLFLSISGNIITNLIANAYHMMYDYDTVLSSTINVITSLLIGLLCLYFGRKWEKRKGLYSSEW